MPRAPRPLLRPDDREILRLAVPAFGALVAEPLFLMADSAVVGHLGTPQLAGLGVASTVLSTLVGVLVFLAYATTAAVARRLGAGDRAGAIRQGVDGIWLAVGLGAVLLAATAALAGPIVCAFGTGADAAPHAETYLRISAFGIPAMLIVLAATGVLRGLQDTRTPLVVAVAGFAANLALNLGLIYGAGMGIAGSALGTVIAQWGMAAVYLAVTVRGARASGASLRPDTAGIRASATAGVPLFIRTLGLRAVIVIAAGVATRLGDDAIAAHQVATSIWNFLGMGLDAVAIAGQAIIGHRLGAGDAPAARAATRRMVQWGVLVGVVLGVLVAVGRPLYIPLFTSDPAVRNLLLGILLIVALAQPFSGVVFTLDGVLMGAGDGPFLAWAMLGTLVLFTPFALLVPTLGLGLDGLWWAMLLFIVSRGVFLVLRIRTGHWQVTGAVHP
ncbi:MATE family efflux transporter [Mangrovactinospora gilvigrisea]|uniref:MATE family efflux transporter n=1 Tax=Mangrovactinospora gilvigrisea TaxID=1428644 RepID=A0A1J7BVM2_9ACTN|nr:MATE family efflux transporter [Mangrovactinospora gilvigrisea]